MHASSSLSLVALLLSAAACTREYHPEFHPQTSYSVHQSVSYPTTIFQVGPAGPTLVSRSVTEAQAPDETSEPAVSAVDPSHVQVYESQRLDRPSDVIGVVDVLVSDPSHDAAIDAARQRAAELGADAIVGIEVHRAEREGQSAHVSGLAVRFTHAGSHSARE